MDTRGVSKTETQTLSAVQAFVVHLTADSGSDTPCGRVEHITSGATARFATTDELLGFMRRTIAANRSE